jgi:hypothetical protein
MQSIVVVDDSPEICRMVQLGLAQYGYIAALSLVEFAAHLRGRECTLFDYWQGRRDDAMPPRRGSIDPADIPALLPNLQLHMQEPDGRFLCRLSGTAITRLFGFDETGCRADELPLPDGRGEAPFGRVVAHGAPLLYRAHVTVPGREWRSYRRLMLPLRHGDTVNMVLSHLEPCASFTPAPTAAAFALLEGWELTGS